MKILCSGGGTGGSVTPLLSVIQEVAREEPETFFLWIGTFRGPERKLVQTKQIQFMPIFSGKLRRYFSWQNFVDPFFILLGFAQSLYIIKRFNPDVVVSAGGFVSVPVVFAARIFNKKVIIHQLDIQKGLANKLMTPLAHKITVSFKHSVADFPKGKVLHIGTPIRSELLAGDKERAQAALNLDPELPTILVLGGGTGAMAINKVIISALPEILNFAQVIHITGAGKGLPAVALKEKEERYHSFEFVVEEMPNLYAAADLVICRAGMATLTELAALAKPSIVIPIPGSHQELNAEYFAQKKAVLVFDQTKLSAQTFTEELRELLQDKQSLHFLSQQITKLALPNAAHQLRDVIFELYDGQATTSDA